MDIQDEFYALENKLQNQMRNIKSNSNTKYFKEFLDTFLQYGIFLSSNKSEELQDTVILDFTTENKRAAIHVCDAVENYFMILSSKLGYTYEDNDDQECVLADICRARSALEFFIDFFQTQLRKYCRYFDDWYMVTSGIPKFDELLTSKIKQNPILLKAHIPNDIPETHWWWQHLK